MTGPSSNRESNPQILLVSAGSPLSSPFTISRGNWGPIRYQGAPSGAPTPDPHGAPHPGSQRGYILSPGRPVMFRWLSRWTHVLFVWRGQGWSPIKGIAITYRSSGVSAQSDILTQGDSTTHWNAHADRRTLENKSVFHAELIFTELKITLETLISLAQRHGMALTKVLRIDTGGLFVCLWW